MAISADYITLQRHIADDLGDRQDLLSPLSDESLTLSPIQNAIQSAIAKWEREPFYFNELYDTSFLTTVKGQEFYTSTDAPEIATLAYILRLHVLISSNRYPLSKRTWEYLDDTSVNPNVTGQPIDYAYFNAQIRLYPIPDGAYPITCSATKRLSALSANSDSNAWTQDAYDLIRSEAKLILAREVLHDDELVSRMEAAIYGQSSVGGMFGRVADQRGYLYALKAETTRRARAKVVPSYF